jgi:hypothetical protein
MPHVRARAWMGGWMDAWVSLCGLRGRADLPRTLLYSSSQSILKISVGFPQPMNCETTRKTINKKRRSTMHIINLSVASLRPISRTYTQKRTRTQTQTPLPPALCHTQTASKQRATAGTRQVSLTLSLYLSLARARASLPYAPR